MRGKITGATGAIILGEGFTCTRTAEGNYTIELTFSLPTTGVMVVSVAKVIEGSARVESLGKKVFKVQTANPGMTAFKDVDFTFMIVAS
jgi:L-lactate utilization protein LutB